MRAVILIHLAMIYFGGAAAIEETHADGFVPVCERSEVVREAIEKEVGRSCDKIGEGEISGVTQFELPQDAGRAGDYRLRCGDFSGMSELGNLQLRVRQETIPECLLSGLENLVILTITGSPSLTSLPEKLFAGLHGLHDLTITGTRIAQLPDNIFLNMKRLRNLNLSFNELGSLANVNFSNMVGLRDLYISDNKLTDIPLALFDSLGLEHLDLSNNPLQPDGSLAGDPDGGRQTFTPVCERSTGLVYELQRRLNKNCNKITAQELLSLVDLKLSVAENLRCTDLSGMKSLKYLTLYQLGEVPSCLLSDNKNLVSLRIRGSLSNSSVGIFSNLSQLRSLTIWNSRDGKLERDLFDPLVELRYLDLSLGHVTELDQDQFMNLPKLKFLNLSRNQIAELPDRIFANQTDLRRLDLSDNRLTQVKRAHFQASRRLTTLNLSTNHIKILPEDLIVDLSELELFAISFNRFNSIPRGFFSSSLNLRMVEIRLINLVEVPDFTFVGLPRLEEVEVTSSPLTRTSKAAFQGVARVVGLPAGFPFDNLQEEWRRE